MRSCEHPEPISYVGTFEVLWCPLCGALDDGAGWVLSKLAATLPAILVALANDVESELAEKRKPYSAPAIESSTSTELDE